ncbi:MAG: YecA family protein [Rubrivivax sp.]
MDGYLHAVAIGPITLPVQQWLPPIWGQTEAQGMMSMVQNLEQLNRVLELVMRHFNSIIAGLEDESSEIYPHWSITEFEGREFDDAESWAWGFVQGVNLCPADWQPLLETEQGRAWYRSIGLLGEMDFGPEQDELTCTPAQRAEL